MNNYPEHDKVRVVQAESQAQGGFLEWLSDQGYEICKLGDDDQYFPTYKSITKWLEEYHNIDGDKLDDEKRQMLENIRKVEIPLS
jgi:hypothetical protein